MENKMKPIVCEKDLEYYENNLRNISCNRIRVEPMEETLGKKSLTSHLVKHKGKLVKVETVMGNCTKSKNGILLEVGSDFIVLRMGNVPVSTTVPVNQIHFITVIHDNNRKRMF